MKSFGIVISVFSAQICTILASPNRVGLTNTSVTYMIPDLVIQALQREVWSPDENECLVQTLMLLENTKNHTLWAVWIWNSMQQLTGSLYGSRYNLGNYDQCIGKPPNTNTMIDTQYCLVDINLTPSNHYEGSMETYLNIRKGYGRNLNLLTWGVCLPATCEPKSIPKIVKAMYSVNPLTHASPEVILDNCQMNRLKGYTFGFLAFSTFTAVLVGTVIMCTFTTYHVNSKYEAASFAESFCLKRNWNSLVRVTDTELASLNFLKALVVGYAVTTHVMINKLIVISNGLDFVNFMKLKDNKYLNIVNRGDVIVNGFLGISSILLTKGLMEKNKTVKVMLISRYFRIMGTFSYIIFFMATTFTYSGDGPLWEKFATREQESCNSNWLSNILMLNNYINPENYCLMISWYIPCDYHLAVIGTILYCLWQKNKELAMYATTLLSALSVVVTGVSTYWYGLPGLLMTQDVDKIADFRKNDMFLYTYIRTHSRVNQYLIGMFLGYLISAYDPRKYKGLISKKWTFIIIYLAMYVAVKVMIAAASWCLGEYHALNSAVYTSFDGSIWTAAFCVLVAALEYGDTGSLRKFMQWPGFVYFSRLACGIYLSHLIIIHRSIYSTRNPQTFDMFLTIAEGFGVLVLSTISSAVLWLLVEAPVNNLTKLYLKPMKVKECAY